LIAFFFQAEDGIRDPLVTGVQTCALPICVWSGPSGRRSSTSDWFTCGSSSTATIVNNWLTSNDNGDGLDCELVVDIRNVQSYAESSLCSECCRIAGARASRRATSATPSYPVRRSTSSRRRSTSHRLTSSSSSTATIVNNGLASNRY